MFLSLVRPDRISSPITSTAAVTMSGLALMTLSLWQVRSRNRSCSLKLCEDLAWHRHPLKPRLGRSAYLLGSSCIRRRYAALTSRFRCVFAWPEACNARLWKGAKRNGVDKRCVTGCELGEPDGC